MAFPDSLEKIIRYIAVVSKDPVEWEGKVFEPLPIILSPSLFRHFSCPPGCGACCSAFTLDYLPTEKFPEGVVERYVEVNGEKRLIYTYYPKKQKVSFRDLDRCDFLDLETGRCKIYPIRPFSCRIEPLRLIRRDSYSLISFCTFSRWKLMWTVEGKKGAKCRFSKKFTKEDIDDLVEKFEQLRRWAEYFGVHNTWIPEIIRWIRRRVFLSPIHLRKEEENEGILHIIRNKVSS